MIRIREKHQVTLPRDVVAALALRPNDYLQYEIDGNAIVLRLAKQNAPEDKLAKVRRLAGSGEKAFESPAEVDAYIRELRQAWQG